MATASVFSAKSPARRVLVSAALLLLAPFGPRDLLGQTTKPGFRDRAVGFIGLKLPTAVAFSPDGRVFVAEKSGLIKVFSNLSDTTSTVFADLRTKVFNNYDRGLLGMALDPNFPATPYVYVLYSHDAPIGGTAPRWGPGDGTNDPCPTPPGPNGDGCVISGRLSRLQASGDVMVGPEQVLIEDWFQQYPSHSVGSIVFGSDGALYATGGDGAAFQFADYGQDGDPRNPAGDPPVGVGGVQTPPTAEGGSLRAQDLRTVTGTDPVTLNGTLIRVDPVTGAGLPGNPLYTDPDPNARRVVAHGLRNPFRMTSRPGTSEIWIADVGWHDWDEINRVQLTAGLTNFGWPCYEGVGRMTSFDNLNLDICENLYNDAGAVTAPYYTYHHSAKVVPGESCSTGSSSPTGVAFYPGTGGSYPDNYRNALFIADSSRQCIWAMLPDANGNPSPSNLQTFVAGAKTPVQLTIGPGGDLFYVDHLGQAIRQIQFDAPVAVISANPLSGPAPLEVSLSGAGSTHPDPQETLSYSWDLDGNGVFGDATTVQTSYTFTAKGSHTVSLRVSDTHGDFDIASVVISVDNDPPVPVIAAPLPTLTWTVDDVIAFAGSASDPQDGTLPASSLSWSLLLHHCPSNCHAHTLSVSGSSFVAPDHEYPSHLELKLTAVDSSGLEASTSVLLYPRTVALTLATSPTGLQLSHNATSGPSPLSSNVIIGSQNSISAPSPQVLGGNTYQFQSWSDGGAASHNITAPAAPATYTATFVLQAPTIPPPWVEQDVGAVGLPGSADHSNGTYTVRSSGTNIAGTADGFHFVYQPITGDGTIVARIWSVQNITPSSKGGIMIRESLAAGSSNVAMILTGGNRFQFQQRVSTGATTSVLSGTQTPPHWVKLVRSGNTFTAYRSSNGVNWTQYAAPVTVPMSASVYVGLVMSSNNLGVLGTATLDNVNVALNRNALPSATITSPTAGATFTDPASISIEAAASDGDGSVSRMDFFAGTTLLGFDTSAPYSYSWNAPPQGSHSLTARATDNLGATATSSPVTISVSYTPQVPAPWTHEDVGAVGVPGTATYAAGVFQVTASGVNIAGTADGFHFVYRPISGDGEVVARITSVQNTTPSSKGGIMIRESLNADSSNVAMVLTGGNRLQFQRRASTGGTTSVLSGTQTPPHWVKLVRSGNTFTAYRSSSGVTWTQYATPITVPMSANVYVGLVMSNNNNTLLGTATLDNVASSTATSSPVTIPVTD